MAHLQPWGMREIGLWALRVVVAAVADSAVRRPHCQAPAVKLPARPVPIFRSLVHELGTGERRYAVREKHAPEPGEE